MRLARGVSGTGREKVKVADRSKMRGVVWVVLADAARTAVALTLAAAVAAGPRGEVRAAASADDGVTHLRITNQVILPNVTRLGINLGEQTYYDSGQMVHNLLYRNPGFEGMAYRSILHCLQGGPSNCTDTRHSFTWPAGFWDGASFEVLEGAAVGRKGTVKSPARRRGWIRADAGRIGAAIGAATGWR